MGTEEGGSGMTYQFKKAIREEVGLLLGLVGPSGSGKTYSAMRIAAGIVGKGNRFAVIDTESRRALHYADMFDFDHLELHPPFRPATYADAIRAADEAGYKAIVVDSCSHEWAGEGGILDWQEEELTRMAGNDYHKRDTCKMAAWIKPKMAHKQMVQRLLQVKANLILCFRAEEKVKMEKDAKGKTQIVPVGWQPICSKELPYELTVSFLLHSDKPGIPQPIKLQEQHKPIFPLDKLLNEDSGRLIAEWAKGGIAKPAEGQQGQADLLPPDNKAKKRLEALIGKEDYDREDFKAWLYSMKMIGLKDGKPSISTMTEGCANGLAEKWDDAKKRFNAYIDTKNAAN